MKRKVISLLLALVATVMVALPVYAENTTTLTTTVPEAAYTLNIPANQEITFGRTSTGIGNVTVTDSSGFAEGKNLEVTVTYDEFTSESVSTKIPFRLNAHYSKQTSASSYDTNNVTLYTNSKLTFKGSKTGAVTEQAGPDGSSRYVNAIYVCIDSSDWGKALAGTYTATITFTAEVVVEN